MELCCGGYLLPTVQAPAEKSQIRTDVLLHEHSEYAIVDIYWSLYEWVHK